MGTCLTRLLVEVGVARVMVEVEVIQVEVEVIRVEVEVGVDKQTWTLSWISW